jgi:SAM-dependent methyltransferase
LPITYVEPNTGAPLEDKGGVFTSRSGASYPIVSLHGRTVPVFTGATAPGDAALRSLAMYGNSDSAVIYRNFLDWLFRTFEEDEKAFRAALLAKLNLRPGHDVLVTGCGLGDDVFALLDLFGSDIRIWAEDVSLEMIAATASVLADRFPAANVQLFAADAAALPFADAQFDGVFHFGGINQFDEPGAAIAEMARVAKAGGRVVFGDESVAPWLRDTDYGRMAIANNPLWANDSLIGRLPFAAVDVDLSWVLGNCFYMIGFTRAVNGPHMNPDIPHLGWKGGSMRRRYYGRLEGVSPDLKEAVVEAARQSGVSVVDWLEEALKAALPK